jgi:pimeloyl-ACP methyl ester carboxylesterase
VRIFWERGGNASGPRVMLIRGLSRSSRYWLELRPMLERDHDVVVLDNRGVGKSSAVRPGFRVEDMADDCGAVLREVGACHVFGISLGGMIAQHVALRHPSYVKTLMLGATTFGGPERVRVPRSIVVSFLRTATMSTERAIRFTAPLTLDPDFVRARPDVVDRWVEIATSEPRHRGSLIGQLLAAARHDASKPIAKLAMPVLVVTGDRDRMIPPANSEQLAARIPNATLIVLAGCAHDFPTEAPEKVAAIIAGFVARHADR